MRYKFNAKIYKSGINWCVDVPVKITQRLSTGHGPIYISGSVNDFKFAKNLVPVKEAPYRLFVNQVMMKGGNTASGKTATFEIEEKKRATRKKYAVPALLAETLDKDKLADRFNKLTASRKNDILKYFSYIKTPTTMEKNIAKLISQLRQNNKDVRIP